MRMLVRLPRSARWAVGLWCLLAVVVFNVTFDWETRAAGHAFIGSQVARRQQGEPPISINDGFRPMVRAAARHSAMWLVLVAAAGTASVLAASRAGDRRGIPAVPAERPQVR